MAKRGMVSNLNYDGENVDYDDFYKAFGYDAAMNISDNVQQAHVIQYCLSGKALRLYNSMTDRVFLESVLQLNTKSGESIASFAKDLERLVDKDLPGLDGTVKTKLLKSRLVSSVPENTKDFLELLSDRTLGELIIISENQVAYKSVVPGQFSQEIKYKAVFDFDKNAIRLSDDSIRNQIYYPVEVKARSEFLVEVETDTKEKSVLFEPEKHKIDDLNKDVDWASSVDIVSDNGKIVSIINVSDTDLKIESGAVIGRWEETEVIDEEPEERNRV
ncbi:hypothetical protein BpHYR1_050047 [Brachionus plicatilis]|uniref:Uncharacterized protein n=1 Tax=Brachionus plicatilis TaxID=10195 RepID=A0A3M7S3H4_BRAPC|nr:hypothetical protein BpHYR1_050047 [Brachionus plicatilis]